MTLGYRKLAIGLLLASAVLIPLTACTPTVSDDVQPTITVYAGST
jgi:hypothetical protein